MEHLVTLDLMRPPPSVVPEALTEIVTPLHWQAWDRRVAPHPDQRYQTYIVNGIKQGFRVGFDYTRPLCSARSNMSSSRQFPQIISQYLAEECAEGRIVGPLPRGFVDNVQVSRFGLIPKKSPGEWRLIVDLSSPEGRSVNDGVYEHLCSLKYVTVEDALQMVVACGRGALLVKVDVRKAYRNVPIHPADRPLLGMMWEDHLYIDTALPFGLRSAPKIFTALADAAEWIVRQEGVEGVIHYLDDFLIVGPPQSTKCKHDVDKLLEIFEDIGLPVAPKKLEGPSTSLTFLGIEIDTVSLEIRLPADKLHRLQDLLRSWLSRSSCTKQELESLIGYLSHACYVVRAGKSFLRRLIELVGVARRAHHFVRLNTSHRADLWWWEAFLAPLNHASFFQGIPSRPCFSFFSDASGSVGCGAIWSPYWFQVKWQSQLFSQWPELGSDSITFEELLPILWGLAVWGIHWRQAAVTIYCDNQGAVAARCLFFVKARFDIELVARHVPVNQLADAIYRDDLTFLFSQVPEARWHQCALPEQVIALSLDQHLSWTSPTWRQSFTSCFRPV